MYSIPWGARGIHAGMRGWRPGTGGKMRRGGTPDPLASGRDPTQPSTRGSRNWRGRTKERNEYFSGRRPMVIGVDNIVVSVDQHFAPTMGIARQVLDWLPGVQKICERSRYDVGDVVHCEVEVDGGESHLFFPVTRSHARDLPHGYAELETLMGILREWAVSGIQQISLHKSPGTGYKTGKTTRVTCKACCLPGSPR